MPDYTFLNSAQVSRADIEKLLIMLESYYDTKNDPDQMQIPSAGTGKSWISTDIPECGVIIKSGDEVVGSTLILPCTLELMHAFINGQINEAQLADKIREARITYAEMQTIYACSAYIAPEHRRKNLAFIALARSIRNISVKKLPLFYWEYSIEGKKLTEKLAADFGVDLFARKD